MSDICNHSNWDDYFNRCEDCSVTLEQLPQELQDLYSEQFTDEDHPDPEQLMEEAERQRDGQREDGIV